MVHYVVFKLTYQYQVPPNFNQFVNEIAVEIHLKTGKSMI